MSEFKSPLAVAALKKDKPGAAPPEPMTDVLMQVIHAELQEEAAGNVEDTSRDNKSERKSSMMKHEDAGAKKERYDKIMSTIPYREPLGSAPADSRYSLEVIKGGSVVQRVDFQDKHFFIVGRIPACDITAENPTVSRVHAVFQFIDGKYAQVGSDKVASEVEKEEDNDCEERETQVREKGLYLYDLASTHGTYVNKNRMFPNRFYRLRVGHVIKFGNSARLYIVGGPDDDEEEESDKSVTELLKERLDKDLERKQLMQRMEEVEVQGRDVEEDGISWGMPEDAQEDTENRENPFAIDFQSSELSLDNPKKTLRGWFEREGYDLEYDVREKAPGHFICRIDLPLDGPEGSKVFAEVEVKGKKKEAVHQGALQACQILDKYGVLRQSHHEGRTKRKDRDWADEDYYSSDEDTFLDRTGTVEKKREKRMREAGKIETKIETYETLLEKDRLLQKEIGALREKIAKAEAVPDQDEEVDPLDAYMTDLKAGASDVKKLKSKLREIVADQVKNQKLLDIARPAIDAISLSSSCKNISSKQKEPSHSPTLDAEKSPVEVEINSLATTKKNESPLFGPRIQFKISSKTALPQKPSQKIVETKYPVVFTPDGEEDDIKSKIAISISQQDAFKDNPSKPQDVSSSPNTRISDEDSGHEGILEEATMDVAATIPKKKQRIRKRPQKIKESQMDCDYDAEDPNYSVWVPPSGQKGDGRTSLNDKLGY
ncbi:unnamed protein product [Allacma fusca]|uniref:FHA domain-containing protein n=1 Tax=Allacma fusca TaxID=39272 RepID=A0A8J2K3F9_9HEXA|nr:unnamed protein product [Allacma fusca]